MKSDSSIKKSVTAKEAVKVLHKNGLEITEKEADEILDFLYFMCKLTVSQLVKDKGIIDIGSPKERDKSIKPKKVIKP